MCGIFGYFSDEDGYSEGLLRRMSQVMSHRGPDAEGFYTLAGLGLGHRRLSIIDVSVAANQPMTSRDGDCVIVYNGEVYNFREIAIDLQKEKNIAFRTTSDTEVILEAFVHWGPEFVHRLNGMFAIAIFRKSNQTLYLYRDRIGIKPIYYRFTNRSFLFSSELKGMVCHPDLRAGLEVNPLAVNQFLHLGYIPEPETIYKGFYKFPAGHRAEVSGAGMRLIPYWIPEEKAGMPPDLTEDEYLTQLNELLVSSVKYRLICDVPSGTFLSGGIDSSLVTALAQHLSATPVKTFSIGFTESTYDESAFARNVSEYLGTHHHEFIITEKEAIDRIPLLTGIYDEPFADSSAVPTLLVSEMARRHVTMTLSGDGGDELFLGYGAYTWAARLENPLTSLLRRPAGALLNCGGSRYRRAANVLDYPLRSQRASHIFSQEQNLFKRSEIAGILNPEYFREFSLKEEFPGLNLSPAAAQSLFDLRYYLRDDLLVKVDRASMYHSLETRVPLLDYRIVEFAMNLPDRLRKNGNVTKYLLRKVLYQYVPESYFQRPKWGFSIPLQKWLKSELGFLVNDSLNRNELLRYQIINPDEAENLMKKFKGGGHDYLYNRIWLLICLQQFLKRMNH